MILKLIFSTGTPLILDEPFTLFHAQGSWTELWEMGSKENNPPLHFWITHLMLEGFGTDLFWARFPSVLFSSLTAAVLFVGGRKHFSFKVGLIAAIVYTLVNYHFYFSHEIRVYALFGLLSALAFFLTIDLREKKSIKGIVILGLVNVFLVYAHFLGWAVVGMEFLLLFMLGLDLKKGLPVAAFAFIPPMIAYLPYLPKFLARLDSFSGEGGNWLTAPEISGVYDYLWLMNNAPVITILALIVILGALLSYSRYTRKDWILLFSFFFPLIFMWCISQFYPMYLDRYLIFFGVLYPLLLARSLEQIVKNEKVQIFLMSIFLILFAVTFRPNNAPDRKPNEIAAFIAEHKQESEPVYFLPKWIDLNVMYYLDKETFMDYHGFEERCQRKGYHGIYSTQEIVPSNGSFWLLTGGVVSQEVDEGTQHYLKQFGEALVTHDQFGGYVLYHIARK